MALKRRTTVAAALSPKKQKQNSVRSQCATIEAALWLGAENFPSKVLEMVSGNLAECLGVPKEERHEYHEKVIEMVGEILASVEASMRKSILSAEIKLGAANSEKASRDQAHEVAASAVTAMTEAAEVAKIAVGESALAVLTAKTAFAEADLAQSQGDTEFDAASTKKVNLEAGLRDHFVPLKEGSLLPDAVKVSISVLAILAKDYQFDASMLASLPSAFAKPPSERGSFDAMVWQQFEDEMNKRIRTFEDTLANGATAKAERARKTQTALGELDAAHEKAASCKSRFEQSKAQLEEAKAHHKEAAKFVAQFWPDMKQVEKDLASVKAELAAFTEGGLAAFKELSEHTAIPPTPLPAAAEEEPVAAERAPDAEMSAPTQ